MSLVKYWINDIYSVFFKFGKLYEDIINYNFNEVLYYVILFIVFFIVLYECYGIWFGYFLVIIKKKFSNFNFFYNVFFCYILYLIKDVIINSNNMRNLWFVNIFILVMYIY